MQARATRRRRRHSKIIAASIAKITLTSAYFEITFPWNDAWDFFLALSNDSPKLFTSLEHVIALYVSFKCILYSFAEWLIRIKNYSDVLSITVLKVARIQSLYSLLLQSCQNKSDSEFYDNTPVSKGLVIEITFLQTKIAFAVQLNDPTSLPLARITNIIQI